MYSEVLLKFIGYFPDYVSALSRTLIRFFWTTFDETAVWVEFEPYPKADFAAKRSTSGRYFNKSTEHTCLISEYKRNKR